QKELSEARSKAQNITVEEYFKESARNIPVGRLGKPEELGDVIAFLASERAAFINGANILVDGGQVKGIH
ncbi:MAG: SDR family oxidoreductase, partial [Bacteroidota bacterium]